MRALVHSLSRNRRLFRDLLSRDLRARYVGSSMGFFWSVLFPLINLVVYMFVFRLVLKTRWSDQQSTAEAALLMLSGIMVWHAFAESTSRMTNTLVENQNLIQKVVFPSEVLPAYLTVSALVNMLIGIAVTLLAVVYFAYVRPDVAPPERPIELRTSFLRADAAVASFPTAQEQLAGGNIVMPSQFRCLSTPGGLQVDKLTVRDASERPWSAGLESLPPGSISAASPGDLLYLDGGIWGRIKQRVRDEFTVESWHQVTIEGTRIGAGEVTADEYGAAPSATVDSSSLLLEAVRNASAASTRALIVRAPGRVIRLGGWLALLPLLVALQAGFMLGLGYLLSAFNLLLRDTYHVIGVLLTVWMFATPIFYPAAMVESAGYAWVLRANPMYWLIEGYREVLVYGCAPSWSSLGVFALVTAVLLALGSAFFMAQKPRFPDLL